MKIEAINENGEMDVTGRGMDGRGNPLADCDVSFCIAKDEG